MRRILIALAFASIVPIPAAAQSNVVELRRLLDEISASGSIAIGSAVVTRESGIVSVYEREGFRQLWLDAGQAAAIDSVVESVDADGLRPAHYHRAEIDSVARSARTPRTGAQLDLLRTHALITIVHDLRFGRAATQRFAFARNSGYDAPEVKEVLERILRTGRITDEVRALRPDHFVYTGLVAALAELRALERAGGWRSIPSGSVIRPGGSDDRVPLLRARLAVEGYVVARHANDDPRVFDADLEDAIRRFQHRHGLNEDGAVGPATLRELNTPVAMRIEQVRINLERARWVGHDLPDDVLVVNIAGAKAYLLRNNRIEFESRVVVGAMNTTTPVFRAAMSHIDLNPTWTVPPGIVQEVLDAMRGNPDYLTRNGFEVLNRSGRAVDPRSIDFSRYTVRNFPYVFRQGPVPTNPLGRIKFVFPNRYNVYLHDTPSRYLFERERRLFSHGCIRVEDPVRLAELVLADEAWTRSSIETAIDAGTTRTIPLAEPMPVFILYWTASTDLHGELHYYRDVYQRDAAVLRALDRAQVPPVDGRST